MICFPFPVSLKVEQESISSIRSNKEQGKLAWHYCCWPNIHTGPKPALPPAPSTRDCPGQHPSIFQKVKNLRGKKCVCGQNISPPYLIPKFGDRVLKGVRFSFYYNLVQPDIPRTSLKYFQYVLFPQQAHKHAPTSLLQTSLLRDFSVESLGPYLTHGCTLEGSTTGLAESHPAFK